MKIQQTKTLTHLLKNYKGKISNAENTNIRKADHTGQNLSWRIGTCA